MNMISWAASLSCYHSYLDEEELFRDLSWVYSKRLILPFGFNMTCVHNSENVNILSLFVEIPMNSCQFSTCNRMPFPHLFTSVTVIVTVVQIKFYPKIMVQIHMSVKTKQNFLLLTKSFLTHDKARPYCIIIGYRRANDEMEEGQYHARLYIEYAVMC